MWCTILKKGEERTGCEEKAVIVAEATDGRGRGKGASSSSNFIENVLCDSQNGMTKEFLNNNIPRWRPCDAILRHDHQRYQQDYGYKIRGGSLASCFPRLT